MLVAQNCLDYGHFLEITYGQLVLGQIIANLSLRIFGIIIIGRYSNVIFKKITRPN